MRLDVVELTGWRWPCAVKASDNLRFGNLESAAVALEGTIDGVEPDEVHKAAIRLADADYRLRYDSRWRLRSSSAAKAPAAAL